jgi:hypothetical protein
MESCIKAKGAEELSMAKGGKGKFALIFRFFFVRKERGVAPTRRKEHLVKGLNKTFYK